MRRIGLLVLVLVVFAAADVAFADQTKLVRYPDYHDGKVAFCYLGDIWLLNEKDSTARPLTAHEATELYPKFSPDGKWIAFSSNRSGSWDVYVMPVEGGKPKRLTFHSASDIVLAWTPDSKHVVFRSRRDRKYRYSIYKVSLEGELPERIECGTAYNATFDKTGRYVALNRHYPSYTRKKYNGSNNADVWVFDLQEKKFTRLTTYDGHDGSPMIVGSDVYFVSNRDGTFNLWKAPITGGEAKKVTIYEGEGVAYPSASADGKTIVYERAFELWKLDVETGKYAPIELKLRTDYVENPVAYKKYTKVDDFDISPDGKRAVFSIHGEVFTVPVNKGRAVQLTDSPARDRYVSYGPDGKKVAFVSDRSGEEQVYIINADGTGLQQVTQTETRKLEIDWSPDGKYMSVIESDHSFWIYDLEKKDKRLIMKPEPSRPRNIRWSPDGKWIAYTKNNRDFWSDIYVISATEEKPVEHPILERMPYDEYRIFFTPKKIFFLGQMNDEWDLALFSVDLARQEVDPDDPDAKAKKKKKKEEKKPDDKKKPGDEKKPGDDKKDEKKEDDDKKEPPKEGEKPGEKKAEEKKLEKKKEKKLPEVKVDFDGIEKRVKELIRVKGKIRNLAVSPDGSRIAIMVREARGKDEVNIIYSVLEDGKKLKQMTSGKDIKGMRFSPNGKELYYTSGGSLMRMPATGGSAKKVSFSVRVKVDRDAEYAQVFNECWRVMKYIFYDPDMHGVDWEAMREKYAAVLPSIAEKGALGTIVNKMLGELNASHMGFYVKSERSSSGYTTMHPGFELVPDAESGLYRVGHIYKKGPADKEWVDVKEGDYILSIDGKKPKVPENYWKILNHPLNTRVDIVVSADPEGKEKRTSTVKLTSYGSILSREYYEWVDACREKVDKLSGGRLAYAHIPSMSGRWLEKFKEEIIEFRLKEGLIIDVRNNGGGLIDQQLLDILERRMYSKRITRGSIEGQRPGRLVHPHACGGLLLQEGHQPGELRRETGCARRNFS
jgi:tricorn protease